jgi:hypothetical protein
MGLSKKQKTSPESCGLFGMPNLIIASKQRLILIIIETTQLIRA